jgi:hypothetical protein
MLCGSDVSLNRVSKSHSLARRPVAALLGVLELSNTYGVGMLGQVFS